MFSSIGGLASMLPLLGGGFLGNYRRYRRFGCGHPREPRQRDKERRMIKPYTAVGLIPTVRGIRKREDIAVNLEHLTHLTKAAAWLSSLDLPVRLIAIPEGALQGFNDEVLDLDHVQFARECAIDIPGTETEANPAKKTPEAGGNGLASFSVGEEKVLAGGLLEGKLAERFGLSTAQVPVPTGQYA
jgi:hypothetical protein